MKAKLRRTDALLLAPILLLGGFAYWMQQRSAKLSAPTRIEVRSLQVLPPMPSDIARGFDTRVQLSLGYKGARPPGWGVTEIVNSKVPIYGLTEISQIVARQPDAKPSGNSQRKFVAIDNLENRFDADNDVYRGLYRLKLHGVPSTAPIVVKGELQDANFQMPPGQIPQITRAPVKELAWSAVVRKKGIQTPAPAKVSRYSGLKVSKIVRKDVTSGGTRFFHIEVTCAFAPAVARPAAEKAAFVPAINDIYLVDAKGRHIRCNSYGPLNDPNLPGAGSGPNPTFMFHGWETLPADVSKLKFHVALSVNDFWPLEVEVPVKEIPLVPF